MSDKIQILSGQAEPEMAADDIKVQVANVENVPQAKLDRYTEQSKISTTVDGVDVSYLTKFVLPYNDAYEKFDKWLTQEDIGLI
ncbi:Conserved_hypothetical protein [Hexamita inflata]|uniref:Uncharacterized protein n=1 Tax=Hexamita inflata TaxID=28002 RepID=A0AA86UKI2_9EUKA|nr:Conserved hypothetical protein [Hexamita inflata]